MAATVPTAPAGPAVPLLQVRGLTVDYPPLRVLDGVDLLVRPGELVALAGENGAGKTTLVRTIAGDIPPGAGEVLLSGRPLPAGPAAVGRHGVAVVWQDLALCDNLSIAENLLLGRERRRWLLSPTRFHATATELLAGLGIPLPDTTRSVRLLSGGQRQLLAVARAMRDRPRLLVLDEPTASLGVTEAAQVEQLLGDLRARGTTILLVSHDIDQMFRLATRIVVLRHGRVAGDLEATGTHPDEVVALMSGQQVDSSPRRQLTRLHGLVDRLASADPSSSLTLILSALGAALGTEHVCLHLAEGEVLRCVAALGLPPRLVAAWSCLPVGPAGGPVGLAASTEAPVVDTDLASSPAWERYRGAVWPTRLASSYAVPVLGSGGLIGVVTVCRPVVGVPHRDELDLVTLYAGYAAAAVERDRLLGEVTARNRLLETIRQVLETLAGPVPLTRGLVVALQALRHGLEADEVALLCQAAGGPMTVRAGVDAAGPRRGGCSADLLAAATPALAAVAAGAPPARHRGSAGVRVVTFAAPGQAAALAARWRLRLEPDDAGALLDDAAHSLRLALEREEAEVAHQAAEALRRTQELQRAFLTRLSHELRTPLTAIQGYASSLLQTDVTWDSASQERFLGRIAGESARLGRLVGDLLDFSAIESGLLRLQPDWCDLGLVLEAAAACLPPHAAGQVEVTCSPGLPTVWGDHDRLEQVFVNLMDNALRHNPPGTRVWVHAGCEPPGTVVVSVVDDGVGITAAPGRPASAGTGLGLSIAAGIAAAHGGVLQVRERPGGQRGTCCRVVLPVEGAGAA